MAFEGNDDCDVHMPPKDLAGFDLGDGGVSEDRAPVLASPEYKSHRIGDADTVVERVDPVEFAKTKMEELYMYIQTLEQEKVALVGEADLWKEREAKQRASNVALSKRLEELERSVCEISEQKAALHKRVFADDVQPAIRDLDKEYITLLSNQIEALQMSLDETDRARQSAVFKIGELSVGETSASRNEWIAQFKHDYELLLQRSKLSLAQLSERHAVAMDVALRKQQLDHASALDKLRLAHEIQLAEWRHEEARRAKEVESAMEADRHSVRLEMKHHMQNAQIHQKIAIKGSALRADPQAADDAVVVRLALEALRGRRMDALKKLSVIRNAFWRQELHRRWSWWRHAAVHATRRRDEALRGLRRCVQRRAVHGMRGAFHTWRWAASAASQQGLHTAVMQQVLSGERILRWVVARWRRRVFVAFWTWRMRALAAPSSDSAQLRSEITKLHEELAKTKAETWRCKRQMLQQFKQSAM
ncbi:hypothetical protein ACHHYP_00457 [Achlya hypogyna]|uniref:Uncharacterized protein n=1 Tax=Achlya hypogyna TaxID=1202772 RepID=A0A1V9ZAX2_ACHHY|nr:hypothetical protein ACHHYP_00457 [Achlya hypogyna]